MKKLLATLIAALLAVCALFAFTACGDDTDKKDNEPPVPHTHVWAQTWAKDETHHWHECTAENCTVTENSQKDGYAAHDFSNGDCICGEIKPHKHVWAKTWTKDKTHHWHECTAEGCTVTENSQKSGYSAHDLSNGDCICGEKNPHEHVWSQTWTKGETHHWHECTVDGCYATQNSKKNGYGAHNTSGEGGTCSVCGWLTPTKGLKYALNADGKSSYCAGIGTATETNIIIAEAYNGIPVTRISNYAFESCSSLRSVTIPNSVNEIGRQAFYNCSKLTSVTIPGSVSVIGYGAFYGCTSLANVAMGNGVTKIEQNAFRACKKITGITIPKSVTEIGDAAFYGCTSLTSVTIPNGVTSISDWAFRDCSTLTSVIIENGATKIGESAFRDCSSLTNITIPVSIAEIAKYSFSGCSNLKILTFEGTTTQWKAIKKESYWNNIIKYTVHCTDGDIT